ncbi:MAG: hypothetical protein GY943_15655 [Chloroflexi bacterium]|nr:hypothetical protein [Chloroflexota bacterium]
MSWALWYPAIYLLVMTLISYGLIRADLINSSSGGLFYRFWGIILFQFVISTRFKEDFDFLLTLSNSRKEIFQSLLGVAIAFSILFSGLIVLERLIIDGLNNRFGYQNFTDPFHFFAPYVTDNLFLQFLFFLLLSTCCSIIGTLIGSLFYRFGKIFRLAFWIIFSSIFMIYIPLLLWSLYQSSRLSTSIGTIGEFLSNFNVLASSGYLFMLTIVLSLGLYLNIRRLPQK